MLSAFVGLLVAVAGLWGLGRWWPELIAVAKGILPLSFFLGGVVAIIAGVSSVKKSPDSGRGSGEGKKSP